MSAHNGHAAPAVSDAPAVRDARDAVWLRDVVGFTRALRAHGLPIGIEHSESFAQALAWVDPLVRRELYLAARATLVSRREDLAVFDDLFALYFGGPAKATPQPAPPHIADETCPLRPPRRAGSPPAVSWRGRSAGS